MQRNSCSRPSEMPSERTVSTLTKAQNLPGRSRPGRRDKPGENRRLRAKRHDRTLAAPARSVAWASRHRSYEANENYVISRVGMATSSDLSGSLGFLFPRMRRREMRRAACAAHNFCCRYETPCQLLMHPGRCLSVWRESSVRFFGRTPTKASETDASLPRP